MDNFGRFYRFHENPDRKFIWLRASARVRVPDSAHSRLQLGLTYYDYREFSLSKGTCRESVGFPDVKTISVSAAGAVLTSIHLTVNPEAGPKRILAGAGDDAFRYARAAGSP